MGEAPTFEADTPVGKYTYSKSPEPTRSITSVALIHVTTLWGPQFEDENGIPLYDEDGISLLINYGGEYEFMIAVWGVDDIRVIGSCSFLKALGRW